MQTDAEQLFLNVNKVHLRKFGLEMIRNVNMQFAI